MKDSTAQLIARDHAKEKHENAAGELKQLESYPQLPTTELPLLKKVKQSGTVPGMMLLQLLRSPDSLQSKE